MLNGYDKEVESSDDLIGSKSNWPCNGVNVTVIAFITRHKVNIVGKCKM